MQMVTYRNIYRRCLYIGWYTHIYFLALSVGRASEQQHNAQRPVLVSTPYRRSGLIGKMGLILGSRHKMNLELL